MWVRALQHMFPIYGGRHKIWATSLSMKKNTLPLLLAIFFSSLSISHAGDAVHGKEVFKLCKGCHSVVPGEHRYGPSLAGVVGRTAGKLKGYVYSDALAAVKFRWSEQAVVKWISDEPKNMVPGTRMEFPGMPNSQDAQDLASYLATVKAK